MDAETRKSARIVDGWLTKIVEEGAIIVLDEIDAPRKSAFVSQDLHDAKCEICRGIDIPDEAVYGTPNGEDIDEARDALEVEDCE